MAVMIMIVVLVTMAGVIVAITVVVWALQIIATMADVLHLAEMEAVALIGTDAVMQAAEVLVPAMEYITPVVASASQLPVVVMVVIPEDGTHQATIMADEHSHAPEVQTQQTAITALTAIATGAMEWEEEMPMQAPVVLAALATPIRKAPEEFLIARAVEAPAL